jgi:hypothetical protein
MRPCLPFVFLVFIHVKPQKHGAFANQPFILTSPKKIPPLFCGERKKL